MTDMARRASLRRQLVAVEAFRDAIVGEPADDYRRWATALVAPTDALLHELLKLEGGHPYPHPLGTMAGMFRDYAVLAEGWLGDGA